MLVKLVGAPVFAPVAGFKFILKTLLDVAEKELYDVEKLTEQLLLAQVQLESGEITEAEFKEREADIIARLRHARERQQQRGQ